MSFNVWPPFAEASHITSGLVYVAEPLFRSIVFVINNFRHAP